MKVWKKQTVVFMYKGKRVDRGMPGAKPEQLLSKRFYGTLKTASGKRKQVPLCENKRAAEEMLQRLQLEEDRQMALGIDHRAGELRKSIEEHITEFGDYMTAKDDTPRYVRQTLSRIRKIVRSLRVDTARDLEAGKVSDLLARWRSREKSPMSKQTTNHYSRAIKAFTRWLWVEQKAGTDSMISLRLVNAKTDRRLVRRALSANELSTLVKSITEKGRVESGRQWRQEPDDRIALYMLAAYTGLRVSEIASLTRESFDLERGSVIVQAAYSKRRRADRLPLHPSLTQLLSTWLPSKGERPFPSHAVLHHNAVHMLRRDLVDAGIQPKDASGSVVDFHALRHTFITSLAKAGVHPLKAKELARHSTITLTMDVYSHVDMEELRTALDAMPGIPSV
ncbi:tyrosine-type recombinase/integrase [Blastopirellula marina]|uniref:Integrase n=1 Tax=Blastopirellula marina TaxID=124 RepID=A0A2S8GDG9_9BACT|nr:site-specific integrase [Blastopirellula marina]PQO42291.1 hypothetical protein C5Y93_28535 [Blastopirellula marina]